VSQIRLRILGESVIQVGETIVEPSATHLFALLLYLAVERGKLISRGQLASMLFPEANATNAGHNLRQLLYRLRRIGVPLETTAAAVRLPAESVVEAPECLLARSHGDAVLVGPTSYALLPTYCPPTSPLSRWLETYRDEISAKLLRRIARDLARAREGADWTAVERCARALLDLDPLNETATLGLAETMARSGSKHKAVKLLHDFADDVGRSHSSLALPPRLLTRRISEEAQPPASNSVRTPLVGRTDELRTLTEAWSHARRGHYTIAAVTGEKSIGKSRVLEELGELVRMDGSGVVLAARTQSTDCQRPLSLFSDMCAALLLLPGAAGCSPESLPHLRRLQGAPALASDADRADIDAFPPEGATRRAIIDLVDSVSSERPLLICVDDADQLDDSSRELLASLPDISPSLPVLVVVAGNRISRLPQRRDRTTRLGPLTRDDTRALARLMWDRVSHSSSLETLEWCIDAAAGNPGHLDLLVRHTAALRDTPAAPPGLLALLDSRLESLSGADKHVLQACVVFGAECCAETVDALTGIGGYDLLLSLEGLVEAGLVIDSESGISCRSSLLAERIRNSTTPVVRRLLHRRAAQYLERLSDAKWMSQATAWRIADHWQAAGNRAKSLQWRRECWHQSLSIGQPMAAAQSIRSCLPSATSDKETADLLDELILALQHASDVGGQLLVLRQRLALCDRIGDPPASRLRLAADLADARFHNYEDTTSLLPELQTLVAATELDEIRRLRVAKVLMITADSLFDESLAQVVYATMPRQPKLFMATLLRDQIELIYHTVFGNRDVAMHLAGSVDGLAAKHDLSPASLSAQLTAAIAYRMLDSRPSDTTSLERLYERCLSASMHDAAVRVSVRIGNIHFEDGALALARFWCDRASALIERSGIQRFGGDYIALQIDLALERHDFSAAQTFVDMAPLHLPVLASPRASRELLVYQVRVELHSSERAKASSSRIACLMEWHNRAKHFGRHDDNMQVLWTALWRSERRAEASALLRDYLLNTRRERRACSFVLRSRTAEDPIWRELAEGDTWSRSGGANAIAQRAGPVAQA
jgi:DNA-binding SARP family transcriptional activator